MRERLKIVAEASSVSRLRGTCTLSVMRWSSARRVGRLEVERPSYWHVAALCAHFSKAEVLPEPRLPIKQEKHVYLVSL